jgi:hypothetical protein
MHPNEALLRKSYEALERGDWEAVGMPDMGSTDGYRASAQPLGRMEGRHTAVTTAHQGRIC